MGEGIGSSRRRCVGCDVCGLPWIAMIECLKDSFRMCSFRGRRGGGQRGFSDAGGRRRDYLDKYFSYGVLFVGAVLIFLFLLLGVGRTGREQGGGLRVGGLAIAGRLGRSRGLD